MEYNTPYYYILPNGVKLIVKNYKRSYAFVYVIDDAGNDTEFPESVKIKKVTDASPATFWGGRYILHCLENYELLYESKTLLKFNFTLVVENPSNLESCKM
jgi:hypothetical protein